MRELKRILHVEDVPSIQVITRIALEKLGGFEVLSCPSGQAALEQVEAFAPQLILLDVMLPQMDGVELLRQLAERIDLSDVPVVFLTGNLQFEEHDELSRLGMRAVLHKPFDPLQLATQLRTIWEERHHAV
ncbi:response regulator [Stutzerimonas degradans]|uniref:response regulator n=1 Tax=Stutzerimonas degradans TaxID=2968968 RepID=UPI0013F4CD1B|nr:response regulator [Stutzerimonas degradans]NHC10086.1 response regulator [Stutzerimonas degradans]